MCDLSSQATGSGDDHSRSHEAPPKNMFLPLFMLFESQIDRVNTMTKPSSELLGRDVVVTSSLESVFDASQGWQPHFGPLPHEHRLLSCEDLITTSGWSPVQTSDVCFMPSLSFLALSRSGFLFRNLHVLYKLNITKWFLFCFFFFSEMCCSFLSSSNMQEKCWKPLYDTMVGLGDRTGRGGPSGGLLLTTWAPPSSAIGSTRRFRAKQTERNYTAFTWLLQGAGVFL